MGRADRRAACAFVNSATPATAVTPRPRAESPVFTGQNQYDLRELWPIRNGERTDVSIGRQFILDLAAVKIDGLRVDYAGPQQAARSSVSGACTVARLALGPTDYVDAQEGPRHVPAGGSSARPGSAARTGRSAATARSAGSRSSPSAAESAAHFRTANGYWREGPKLDLYHFAIIDLIGNVVRRAGHARLLGRREHKPTTACGSPRATIGSTPIRSTSRPTRTCRSRPDTNVSVVQNEVLHPSGSSTNEAAWQHLGRPRAAAALLSLTAVTFRYRPDVALIAIDTVAR